MKWSYSVDMWNVGVMISEPLLACTSVKKCLSSQYVRDFCLRALLQRWTTILLDSDIRESSELIGLDLGSRREQALVQRLRHRRQLFQPTSSC
jgi:hypothetical protein